MKSLNGTPQQIKYHALIAEHKRTKAALAEIVKVKTGLTLNEYLRRPFNMLGFYQWQSERKWLTPKISFWEL